MLKIGKILLLKMQKKILNRLKTQLRLAGLQRSQYLPHISHRRYMIRRTHMLARILICKAERKDDEFSIRKYHVPDMVARLFYNLMKTLTVIL